MWSLEFDPIVPLWLVGGLAFIGAALIGLALAQRIRGSSVRALAVAALAIALLNPIVVNARRDLLSTVVALVVDRSPSQALAGRDAVTEAMREALTERLGVLGGVEVRTIIAGDDRAAGGTELFAALNAGLADVPPDRLGAAIMLTDGQVHDAPRGAVDLGGAPLHALIAGRADERDRRIVIENAPRFGIVGEEQTVTFRVLDDGSPAGARVLVSVYGDGQLLRSETVAAGAEVGFTFNVDHGGANVLEFAAEPLAGELTALNNRAVVELTGIRENLRVLLVSGEPHAGERTWRDLLKSDASVDLIHFTILRPPEKQDGTPVNQLALISFPTRELFAEKIYEFDLIIFDRYQEQGVLPPAYFDNIALYVRAGGAMLIAAGPDNFGFFSIYNTSLAQILPVAPTGDVIETPFYARLTEAGLQHPVTRGLRGSQVEPPDWSRWFRLVAAQNPRGDVIMEGPDRRPLLVLGHEGEGRIAMLLSDQAWLWARGFEGGGPHVDLLRRLAHWLMKEPDLEEEALRAAAAADGDLTIERQTMADAVGPLTVTSPAGEMRQVQPAEIAPGLWRAVLAAADIGLWRVTDGDLVAVAHVGPPNPREYLNVRSTLDVLEPAVEAGNGHLSRMTNGAGTLDPPRILPIRSGGNYGGGDWLGVRMTEASILLGIERYPLFIGFLGLAILLTVLAATWFREGR